jgi:hypothetical protein
VRKLIFDLCAAVITIDDNDDPCQQAIGRVLQEINFRNNSGTERKHDLAEGRFSA